MKTKIRVYGKDQNRWEKPHFGIEAVKEEETPPFQKGSFRLEEVEEKEAVEDFIVEEIIVVEEPTRPHVYEQPIKKASAEPEKKGGTWWWLLPLLLLLLALLWWMYAMR